MPEHTFDPLLLSQARLGIVTALVTRRDATFSDLKALLGMTQGNLGIHLQKLEEAGYVAVKKEFVHRRPRTTVRLTAKGRKAFMAHVEELGRIAREAGV
ncbi:transcriptional regulator [bacterium]|nr:transcriptional regulator [bacterium]MBU1073661.1 transcriptional regulator [bacterium]MBU1677168.1 transcriptional regulator [bacterium]